MYTINLTLRKQSIKLFQTGRPGPPGPIAADALGYVYHGGDNNVDRPTGFAAIAWVGSVEPLQSINGDIWYVL